MILAVALAFGADCPTFRAEQRGRLPDGVLLEASGLVASGHDPDRLWSHDDRGGAAELVALDRTGAVLGHVPLQATATDWEDLARVGTTLYVADIGDNWAWRYFGVTVYAVEEPETLPVDGPLPTRAIHVRYPDGPRDAEVLLADPRDGSLWVVSKGREQAHGIYRLPPDGGVAERMGSLPYQASVPFRTGGDVAPDGSAVVLRGYTFGWWYPMGAGQTVADALQGTPCPLPLAPEPQGEALAFGPDGWLYSLSEQGRQPLWGYRPVPAVSAPESGP